MKNLRLLSILPLALAASSCITYGKDAIGLAPTHDGAELGYWIGLPGPERRIFAGLDG